MSEFKIRSNTGERPCFFDDPAIDQLLGMLLAMSAELAVVRDRLDTVERLLERKGVLVREEIEAYRPDEKVAQERRKLHQEFLQRFLRIVRDERERLTPARDMKAYRQLMEEFGRV
jgi:hypothetical protein